MPSVPRRGPHRNPACNATAAAKFRQGNAVDVIEIDAATNRGIDEIRELRDAARYRPARDRFKIYILDEAHQITDAAFNALLKTLEEPPDHIVFMLATTEPENIPQTIRSRCQHFSFHAVKLDDILGQLQKIAVEEHVLADPAALDLLAEAGDGSVRDALSIMDQAIASAPTVDGKPQLSAAEIRDLMGSVPNTVFEQILEHVARNEAAGVLTTANRLLNAGNSPAQIARQFVRYLRNCVVAKIANLTPDSPNTDLLQISPDERRRAARSAGLFTEEELTRFMQVMLRTFDDLGFRQEQRFHLELGMLKLVHLQRLLPMEQFLSRLPRPAESSTPRPLPPRPASAAPPSAAPPAPAPPLSRQPDPHVPTPAPAVNQAIPPTFRSNDSTATTPSVPVAAPPPVTLQAVAEAEADRIIEPSNVSPLAKQDAATPPDASTGLNFHLPQSSQADRATAMAGNADTPAAYRAATESPAVLPDADPEATGPASIGTADATPEATEAASLQAAAVEALFASKHHTSAAEQLDEATWTIAEGELRIQTALSKPLLATIVRPEVEAIVKGALRSKGVTGLRVVFLPGAAPAKAAPKKPRTGSAQARALEHPTVQAAQRLFNAEVTNIFDLRRD